jgi:sulfite dehydrogenase (cytochrome) subunit A
MRLSHDDLSTRVEYSTGRVSSRSLEAFPASNAKLTRRAMFRFAAQLAAGLLMAARDDSSTLLPPRSSSDVRRMARFPEEGELMQTDRPPPLETQLHHFRQDVPPNEAFFVRWHVAGIPTHVDTGVFRLQVDGHVQRSLSFSLDDLRRRFEPVSVIAIAQCSGNSRSLFEPRVPGGQWRRGAMGKALRTGVRPRAIYRRLPAFGPERSTSLSTPLMSLCLPRSRMW